MAEQGSLGTSRTEWVARHPSLLGCSAQQVTPSSPCGHAAMMFCNCRTWLCMALATVRIVVMLCRCRVRLHVALAALWPPLMQNMPQVRKPIPRGRYARVFMFFLPATHP